MKRVAPALVLCILVVTIFQGATRLMADDKQNLSTSGVNKKTFGTTSSGAPVEEFTLTNKNGLIVKAITYGATLTELNVPDRAGKFANVVLGFDSLAPYETKSPYFGATVGRCANRIAGATFSLNGKHYAVTANDGANCLHGGKHGFDKCLWHANICKDSAEPAVEFSLQSADGDQGFPGNLRAVVRYTLTADNTLDLRYTATTDKPCPVNLTNHAYFNLSGAGAPSALEQLLTLNAANYTPVNNQLIPTGKIESVANTAMDFRQPKPIGQDLARVDGGYDHNFVLPAKSAGEAKPLQAASLKDPYSGRVMTMYTTEPGVQFYSGNFLDGTIEGKGGRYPKHSAICLEAQHFPDAVHHSNFPSVILQPGATYRQHTIYALAVEK